jgi:hypothetical protein
MKALPGRIYGRAFLFTSIGQQDVLSQYFLAAVPHGFVPKLGAALSG